MTVSDESDPFVSRLDPSTRRTARKTGGSAVVVGGAMAGLAAAHALRALDWEVVLYERQSYAEKRVNCGEAMTGADAIPLPKTAEYGFANKPPAFEVDVFTGDTGSRTLAGKGVFPSTDAYVTDRNVVERKWAEQVAEDGVDVRESTGVTKAQFREFSEEFDLVVDATGQPSMASKVDGTTDEYAGRMTALNADVEGDFSDLYPNSLILFENYLGYSWAFPKSETRANVGIGWAQDNLPDDYYESFVAACERNGWPVPDRSAMNVYTIPRGPSLDPDRAWDAENCIARVGDAAGIANRFTGKGISQAVESSYLLAELAAEDRLDDYASELYDRMKNEYRLAYIVRGALEDGRPDILGGVMDAVSGIDVESVDREPKYAFSRLVRHPVLLAKLAANPTMLSRLLDAYTDNWEFRKQHA
ncbi:flavin-dependent dehydrogenase [Halogeometricum borinquense DSM 11551]|uniref:Flavin-dependent dehydrogenase n=1 Tax=Halogeometricum borinquense (strain ATCC 700274 / DSM 11551 / JCM 10706 / KCTC 4070 / PR3) TaxID=469382 RepID=E4NQN2_HALBP|nr:NAD(P)/FAD-dependent oxidoreductase [Halogeometricum borinquense]ADQ66720.1 flavin-dependent dehydrogenase [Halogeometricum borinquense DSM 11551]ELY30229.1 flavin-dependent dehydrogenase [Halogeometricum borinquense DSM 11551]